MSLITRRCLALWIVLAAVAVAALPARAELHIDITRGKVQPMPIAIPAFVGGGGTVAADITQVLSADLERSGLFQPIDAKAFIDKDAATRTPPRYGDWRVINA